MNSFASGAARSALFAAASILIAACSTTANRSAVNEDPCTNDPSYCIYPIYEGAIHVDGEWHTGRFRYNFADTKGTRQYWFNKGWVRADETRDASKKDD